MRRAARIDAKHIEDHFLWLWAHVAHGPPLIREHRFAPPRRWRFDFAHPDSLVAIELEGGIYIQGRHSRGAGMEADCEKYNEAVARGWRVIRLSSGMLKREPERWLRLIVGIIRGTRGTQ